MTTAQQDAETAAPYDLTDAASARAMAKAFIEEYRRVNDGALPSGEMVGTRCGMTGRWGQTQLKPFRGPGDEATSGALSERRNGTVGDLVAERAAEASRSAPATTVIGTNAAERPAARPSERPERLEQPTVQPAPAGAGRSGTLQAAAGAPTGTLTPPPIGTAVGPTWRRRKLGEFIALLPLYVIGAGAFVSIWGGWVGLGELTGFGEIELLPGIAPGWTFNTAITLPLGMEAYAAYALKVWLRPPLGLSPFGRTFARRSAIGALILGALGQIAYHLMVAAEVEQAHWLITAFVACLPVGVLGAGAALAHLVRHPEGPQS